VHGGQPNDTRLLQSNGPAKMMASGTRVDSDTVSMTAVMAIVTNLRQLIVTEQYDRLIDGDVTSAYKGNDKQQRSWCAAMEQPVKKSDNKDKNIKNILKR
jgi:hypothetical protein